MAEAAAAEGGTAASRTVKPHRADASKSGQEELPAGIDELETAAPAAAPGGRPRGTSPWRKKSGTMFDFDMLDEEVKGKQGPRQPPQPKPAEEEHRSRHGVSGSRPTDMPDWDAPAPAGWWRVVNKKGAWTGDQYGIMVHWFRCGEILAAKEYVENDTTGDVLVMIRDDGGVAQHALVRGRIPRPNGELLHYGVVMELLPTGTSPPSFEDRRAHQRVIEERLQMKSRTFGEGNGIVDRLDVGAVSGAESKPSNLTVGSSTAPYASGAARALLLRVMDDLGPGEFERKLFTDKHIIIENALGDGTTEFITDMQKVDSYDALIQTETAEVGPWSAMPKRRTLWIDEDLAKSRYSAPAVSSAILFLKGLADALNPILSQYQADRAALGDPEYSSPPAPPATPEAVLTVSPEVMAAIYPGRGCKLPAHVDNSFTPGRGRWNARELTAIIYANPMDWEMARDGGALQFWNGRDNDPIQIEPLGGRLVIFFANCRHEVLASNRMRRAMQLWILRPDRAGASESDGVSAITDKENEIVVTTKSTPGRIWKVLGDTSKSGLIVRKGHALDSPFHMTQLKSGAKLLEVELRGNRLHYKKLNGDGPAEGWVTVVAKTGEKLIEMTSALRWDGSPIDPFCPSVVAKAQQKKGGDLAAPDTHRSGAIENAIGAALAN